MNTHSCSRTVAGSGWLGTLFLVLVLLQFAGLFGSTGVPLAEHPRPDLERPDWVNLNGYWNFQFDAEDVGVDRDWFKRPVDSFETRILVPFPWGSALSEVDDEADIGWYARQITVPESWKGKRIFLVIGASDWITGAWLDGNELGEHQGGYTPFEFELTKDVDFSGPQRLVLRVDDSHMPFKLEGKQGYGPARGIWQTAYLEARGSNPIRSIHVVPDIDREVARVSAVLMDPASGETELRLKFRNGEYPAAKVKVAQGQREATFELRMPNPRLWSLADPYLYQLEVSVGDGAIVDQLNTYFGMRKISVEKLPGTGHPYITLNNEPVYLQMALDQAYHPEGFYTFPTDDFMREEIIRSLKIGLNGMRVHVKITIPRKLYWADRLGMLIMADIPNSWGEPTEEMRSEAEYALRGMIRRDFNHPSIFSWVIFNETWGLITKGEGYKKDTQLWVKQMYELAKELDPTRLVEDNSANRRDHVATDINSWHAYLPGYAWDEHLKKISEDTYPGSQWNFAEGYVQAEQPNFNSECGNVWGYEGSTGDVDWSWDYHRMINAFRRNPKICGWLYTEHHDVINEWNGYYRYDRSEKTTGLSEFVPGMSLKDLHSAVYLSPGLDLSSSLSAGQQVEIPLVLSTHSLDGSPTTTLRLVSHWYGWDELGRRSELGGTASQITASEWSTRELEPLSVKLPEQTRLAVIALTLEDLSGRVVHRNFTTLVVEGDIGSDENLRVVNGRKVRLEKIDPKEVVSAEWSLKSWEVLDGLKINGAGTGFFEYRVPWPEGLEVESIETASVLAELSAKQLLGKDREDGEKIEGDYMRGKGAHDPGQNQNAYPMTDENEYPSLVRVLVNEWSLGEAYLPDDPADHRGILSWHSQLRDRRLREAGSYGYLVEKPLRKDVLMQAAESGELVLRFEVGPGLPGGLAIYGAKFGRYPLDPTFVFVLKD